MQEAIAKRKVGNSPRTEWVVEPKKKEEMAKGELEEYPPNEKGKIRLERSNKLNVMK